MPATERGTTILARQSDPAPTHRRGDDTLRGSQFDYDFARMRVHSDETPNRPLTPAIIAHATLPVNQPNDMATGRGRSATSAGRANDATTAATAPTIQRKRAVGSPGDRCEREADAAADEVLCVPDIGASALEANITGQAAPGGETVGFPCAARTAQRATATRSTAATALDTAVDAACRAGGQPLPLATREFMQARLGCDFGSVRIHTDRGAADLSSHIQALAFTTGEHIFFADGQYNPGRTTGRHLLAHELVHVIQQRVEHTPHSMLGRTVYGSDVTEDTPASGVVVQRQAAPATVGHADVPTAQDEEEFNQLKGRIITNDKMTTPIATVGDYVTYRHTFFGSRTAYEVEAAIADTEFDAMQPSIRDRIGQKKESTAAKKVLYRWIRQAYVNSGIADPMGMIERGATEELTTHMAEIKARYPWIKLGDFAARPKKLHGRYRLGTISEHGMGKAVDVEPSKNPQIPRREWATVLDLAGMSVDITRSRWNADPGAVWQSIFEVNSAYVTTLSRRAEEVRSRRAAAGNDPDNPPAYKDVLAKNQTLMETARRNGIGHGIFDLDEQLVLDFAALGYIWGATFPDPDLHHFEIP
ncbi:eCIS core domain-containing protein [Nocardia gipuzkoensis]